MKVIKVSLTGIDRYTLFGILPFHGESLYLKIVESFRNEIGFDEEDFPDWEKIDEETFEIGNMMAKFIIDQLIFLKESGIITPEQAVLYKKFIG